MAQTKAESAIASSLLKEVTKFGRAVHAEMDALLACARISVSPVEATLFTTTFPCHNCTRHIIAAGIKRVVYIEPYLKSQAVALHEDAIVIEDAVIPDEATTGRSSKIIPFSPFIGVGPRRFFELFSVSLSSGLQLARKRKGKVFVPKGSSRPNLLPRQGANCLRTGILNWRSQTKSKTCQTKNQTSPSAGRNSANS